MISAGIDVSKEKSTVCILKPYGEIVSKPFKVKHVEKELAELSAMLLRLNDEGRVIMEAAGIYHLPILSYLQEREVFAAVVNPFEMKEYRCQGLRRVRTEGFAKTLPEYPVIPVMGGVGNVLAPKLIAEIGDVMRCLKTHKAPGDAPGYGFIMEKEREGKSKRAEKMKLK